LREFSDDGTPSEKGVAEMGRIVELSQHFKNGALKLEARLGKNSELCEAWEPAVHCKSPTIRRQSF